jgi:hypothetical protein
MRTCYLILAHENPRHVLRLANRVATANSDAIVHVDAKSRSHPFSGLADIRGVTLTHERLPVYWGDFSQIEAILTLLRESVRRNEYGRHVLLSGSDYPVQPMEYVADFFDGNRSSEFINCVQMPSVEAGKPLTRLSTYRHRDTDSKAHRRMRRWLVRSRILPAERDPTVGLRGLVPYGGSTWWALTQAAAEYVLGFVATQRRVVRFFRNTVCPDEALFQTILGNSPFRGAFQRSLTFADWSAGGDSPAYITETHLQIFREPGRLVQDDVYGRGEYLFARKFSDASAGVTDDLDRIVRRKVNPR